MYVDSHAHLEMEQFNADREQVLTRARDNGIETIVAIGSGSGPGSLDCGIQLAEKYGFVYATIGIHPHEAKLATEAITLGKTVSDFWRNTGHQVGWAASCIVLPVHGRMLSGRSRWA